MRTQITNYQCPSCTGPLHYVGSSGKLECDFCGSSYDVAEIEALYAEKEEKAIETTLASEKENQMGASSDNNVWDTSDLQEWGAEEDQMQAYSCPSCGAELICDKSTAATSCPYCGNPTVIPGQFSGSLKPDYIIPFKVSKEDAVKALKEHYKGKILLPKDFTAENHIQEIRGIYVPFWLFDGKAEGDASYKATRSHSYTSGDYKVTETEYYDVYRAGFVAFERVPVDASSKMPDDHMDSIEPYHYEELKSFSTAYLPGFLADKFDVTVEKSITRADQRCEGTLSSALRKTVKNYDTCMVNQENIHLQRGKVHYAMMPVWMLNTKWKGKDFLFAMNGQTGKLVGDLPISRGKFWGLFAAIAVPLSVLGSILLLVL